MPPNNALLCELCNEPGGTIVCKDDRCRVVLVEDRDFPGFCRVIWNSHVREMSDLPPADRAHCMDVVMAVERAQRRTLSPEKINLASLGNMVAHLHWHVIPRFADDPQFPQPVWGPRQREGPATRRGLERLEAAILEELAALQAPDR